MGIHFFVAERARCRDAYRSGAILRHGLVKCKTCSRLWNRDTNAASNIWKIAMSAIRGEERPEYLRRARGSISGTIIHINVGITNHDLTLL